MAPRQQPARYDRCACPVSASGSRAAGRRPRSGHRALSPPHAGCCAPTGLRGVRRIENPRCPPGPQGEAACLLAARAGRGRAHTARRCQRLGARARHGRRRSPRTPRRVPTSKSSASSQRRRPASWCSISTAQPRYRTTIPVSTDGTMRAAPTEHATRQLCRAPPLTEVCATSTSARLSRSSIASVCIDKDAPPAVSPPGRRALRLERVKRPPPSPAGWRSEIASGLSRHRARERLRACRGGRAAQQLAAGARRAWPASVPQGNQSVSLNSIARKHSLDEMVSYGATMATDALTRLPLPPSRPVRVAGPRCRRRRRLPMAIRSCSTPLLAPGHRGRGKRLFPWPARRRDAAAPRPGRRGLLAFTRRGCSTERPSSWRSVLLYGRASRTNAAFYAALASSPLHALRFMFARPAHPVRRASRRARDLQAILLAASSVPCSASPTAIGGPASGGALTSQCVAFALVSARSALYVIAAPDGECRRARPRGLAGR